MRPLHEIATEIRRYWSKPFYAAIPYLNAMGQLSSLSDTYGADSAKCIVLYFLSNATAWRGETARRIKKELNGMLKTIKH
jgi:hypothetical protein